MEYLRASEQLLGFEGVFVREFTPKTLHLASQIQL